MKRPLSQNNYYNHLGFCLGLSQAPCRLKSFLLLSWKACCWVMKLSFCCFLLVFSLWVIKSIYFVVGIHWSCFCPELQRFVSYPSPILLIYSNVFKQWRSLCYCRQFSSGGSWRCSRRIRLNARTSYKLGVLKRKMISKFSYLARLETNNYHTYLFYLS